MEEDIKIVEDFIEYSQEMINDMEYERPVDVTIHQTQVTALENLIKGYRELEEENEKLIQDLHEMTISNNHKKENWVHKNCLNGYIPKSKIKNKKEELEKEKEETYTKFLAGNRKDEFLSTKGKMLEGATKALQELMEDK